LLAEGTASIAGSAAWPAARRAEVPSRVDPAIDARATNADARSEPDGETAAAFRGVSFGPHGRGKGNPIVSDLNLELRAGSVTAVIGASGTGKTTLLKLAAGLLEPTEGAIARAAPGSNGTRPAALAMEYPERQLFGRTVDEDVAAALWIRGASPDERRARAREALRAVGLDPDRFGHRVPTSLSEGEKRRAALATLLVEPARLLLFDEPTAGLDPTGRNAVAQTIRRLKAQGHAILLASHDLDFVSGAADRIVVLGREAGGAGRILREGRAPEIWRDEALLSESQLPPPDFVAVARAMAGFGVGSLERAVNAESLLEALSIDLGPAVIDTHRG
jgi:energy-coupling factor transporter ATP-binding protein EcfA2